MSMYAIGTYGELRRAASVNLITYIHQPAGQVSQTSVRSSAKLDVPDRYLVSSLDRPPKVHRSIPSPSRYNPHYWPDAYIGPTSPPSQPTRPPSRMANDRTPPRRAYSQATEACQLVLRAVGSRQLTQISTFSSRVFPVLTSNSSGAR
jgi:hypothetical protein